MPYIEARRNGSGSITSYRIVVSTGYDDYGKQIRHRFLWTPPKPGMSEKQMEKEATAAAYKYEEQINNGFLIDQHETFSQYAQYVLDLKEKTGVRASTIDRYIDLLVRINQAIGSIELTKIRPQHLNALVGQDDTGTPPPDFHHTGSGGERNAHHLQPRSTGYSAKAQKAKAGLLPAR